MKLILHGGVHRTGSTSIQNYLAQNRAALSEQGFFYPGEKENHQDIAWAMWRGSLPAQDFASAISPGDDRTVIVSAEDICRYTRVGFLRRMTAGLDIHGVFFVRRQDDWLESWYNQNIRWPFHPAYSAMSPL